MAASARRGRVPKGSFRCFRGAGLTARARSVSTYFSGPLTSAPLTRMGIGGGPLHLMTPSPRRPQLLKLRSKGPESLDRLGVGASGRRCCFLKTRRIATTRTRPTAKRRRCRGADDGVSSRFFFVSAHFFVVFKNSFALVFFSGVVWVSTLRKDGATSSWALFCDSSDNACRGFFFFSC